MNHKYLIAIVTGLTLLFINTIYAQTGACPCNQGWQHRRTVTIDNSTNPDTLEEYQVKFTYDASEPVSKGYMNPDGSDLRFTDSLCQKQFPYAISEPFGADTTATIWVKVDSIPANGKRNILMHYGNDTAASARSKARTFDFYDGFKDGDMDEWTMEKTNSTLGGGNGDTAVANNQMVLWVHQCLHLDVNQFIGAPKYDSVAIQFSWRTKSKEWYESPGWNPVLGDSAHPYDVIKGVDIQSPDEYGSESGTVEAATLAGDSLELDFLYDPSSHCYKNDHGRDSMWIDDIRVRKYDYNAPVATVNDTTGCNTPAPVRLLAFEGEARSASHVNLTWKTTREYRNERFLIQRSANGDNFQTIGTVTGEGTTQHHAAYQYTDTHAHAGVNYYRLIQVDKDGTRHKHNIITVDTHNPIEVEAYPNPFQEHLTVRISGDMDQDATVILRDLTSKLRYKTQLHLNEKAKIGRNLSGGVYLLQVRTGKTVKTMRVVKREGN